MSCITGDEVGLVKVWNCQTTGSSPLAFHAGVAQQCRERAVAAMCWMDQDWTKCAVVHENGDISSITRRPGEAGWETSVLGKDMTVPVRNGLYPDFWGKVPRVVSCSSKGVVEFRDPTRTSEFALSHAGGKVQRP
jgi:hypothetical protein